nr:uroporphyrinogen-III synthase [Deltaproteobacteria bacterium]
MPYAVITRDVEGSAPYAAALEPLGLEVVTMPVTRTELPDDPNELIRAMEAGGYQAIVCASARAAGAVIRAKGHAPVPEVWCVGPATARVLADAHIPPIVPDGVRDGASLAHTLVAERDLVGKRVLVPRAEDGRDEVLAILREAGVLVDDIVAYRTVPTAADDPELARGRALFEAGDVAICVVFA